MPQGSAPGREERRDRQRGAVEPEPFQPVVEALLAVEHVHDEVAEVEHVFHQEERLYYGLERLWADCPALPVAPLLAASS